MKYSIFSTSSLALIISLTMFTTSNNFNIAFAQESYLKLKSANLDYHNGDLDVDIQTEENIPSEKGKRGFGYGVLTDVGDEFINNVLVAISDIGIQNYDKSTKNDKLHTHVLDLTCALGLVVVRTMKLPRVPQTMTRLIPSILLM
jgi:hypothetical protein